MENNNALIILVAVVALIIFAASLNITTDSIHDGIDKTGDILEHFLIKIGRAILGCGILYLLFLWFKKKIGS